MPTPNYSFTLTEEMVNQLQTRVNEITFGDDLFAYKAAGYFQEMAEQNKPSKMHLLNCCMLGPTSMSMILVQAGIDVSEMSVDKQSYYAVALEEMFGLSTKFKYDKENNQFIAEREADADRKYGDAFTFREEDLELTTWDKICDFFWIETDHAKRVNFIKECLTIQKETMDETNRLYVSQKKRDYLENNKDLYNKNKEFVNNLEDVEAQWKNAFFGSLSNDAKNYKFDNGKQISALSACIAMYNKKYGENICDKNIEEIDEATMRKMKDVASEYLTYQKVKAKVGLGATNISVSDVKLLGAMGQPDKFEIDYDKNVPNINELKNSRLKDQARLQNNYVVLKMKAELANMHKDVKEYALSDQEKALIKESVKVKTEIKLYEDIEKGKYENIPKHLKTINGTEYGVEVSYQKMLEDASVSNAVSKKELNAGMSKNNDLLQQLDNNEPKFENDEDLSMNG